MPAPHPETPLADASRLVLTRARASIALLLLLLPPLASLTACEVIPGTSAARKRDTTVVAPSAAGETPLGGTMATAANGVPAVPSDSSAAAAASADSGQLDLYPTRPRQGGVLFAFARGLTPSATRCTWKSAPIPCYAGNGGVVATVPLPADEPAGTYTLTVERPGGRITRQITVEPRDFGRELVFLDREKYALVRRSGDVARDARALRGFLGAETPSRQWTGRWREPVPGARSQGYGVERFYYAATDSARAITLAPTLVTRGGFGVDTTEATSSDVPSWRHAGIDTPVARRTSVVAPAAGTVLQVGDYILSGKTLLVDHGQGIVTAYFHLDTVLVQQGDRVRAGRSLARSGSTGLSTGPHLHYGVYVHGRDVDPAAWRDMPPMMLGADSTAKR